MKQAKRDSWKIFPMPKEHEELTIDFAITAQQYRSLSVGHIPNGMEDKWFFYAEENTLYVHRSWSGNCVLIADINPEVTNRKITINTKEGESFIDGFAALTGTTRENEAKIILTLLVNK